MLNAPHLLRFTGDREPPIEETCWESRIGIASDLSERGGPEGQLEEVQVEEVREEACSAI